MEGNDCTVRPPAYHVHSKMVGHEKEFTWSFQLISKVNICRDIWTHSIEEEVVTGYQS